MGDSLRKLAAAFADELSALLNATVSNGVRLKSVVAAPARVVVGYRISQVAQDAEVGIPLTIGARDPSAYLGLSFRLGMDERQLYLMVQSSFMGLFLDSELSKPLLHYDYERGKDQYPEAHLQVCAESEDWQELCRRMKGEDRALERLHLPVGGRRYRPTLEDLLDFLICEDLVDHRAGAQEAISAGRDRFQERQLRAAVYRHPGPALAILTEMGLAHSTGKEVPPPKPI